MQGLDSLPNAPDVKKKLRLAEEKERLKQKKEEYLRQLSKSTAPLPAESEVPKKHREDEKQGEVDLDLPESSEEDEPQNTADARREWTYWRCQIWIKAAIYSIFRLVGVKRPDWSENPLIAKEKAKQEKDPEPELRLGKDAGA